MENLSAAISCLWLGLLTSISPCPLASNIAAVCYVTGGSGCPSGSRSIASGISYTAGRMVAYSVLGGLISWQLLSLPAAARFLQDHMNRLLGPMLIAVGLVVLDVISIPAFGLSGWGLARKLGEKKGLFPSFLLGFLFALSFCPISAALFFGSLLPIAVSHNSPLFMPLLYGMGTGIPVVGVSAAIAAGLDVTGKLLESTRLFEVWARRITGTVFLAVGGYYAWYYILAELFQGYG